MRPCAWQSAALHEARRQDWVRPGSCIRGQGLGMRGRWELGKDAALRGAVAACTKPDGKIGFGPAHASGSC